MPVATLGLAGCWPEKDRRDASDDTDCQKRGAPVEGGWDSASYSEGYAEGVSDDILACPAEG